MIICIVKITLSKLFSLIEAYAPYFKFTYCKFALVDESIIALLLCQHVYPVTITRDTVAIFII